MKSGFRTLPLIGMERRSRHHKTATGSTLKIFRGRVTNSILIIITRVIRGRLVSKKNKANIKRCGKMAKIEQAKKEIVESPTTNNIVSKKTISNKSMQKTGKNGKTMREKKPKNVAMNMKKDITRDPIIKELTERIMTLSEIPSQISRIATQNTSA